MTRCGQEPSARRGRGAPARCDERWYFHGEPRSHLRRRAKESYVATKARRAAIVRRAGAPRGPSRVRCQSAAHSWKRVRVVGQTRAAQRGGCVGGHAVQSRACERVRARASATAAGSASLCRSCRRGTWRHADTACDRATARAAIERRRARLPAGRAVARMLARARARV